MKNLLAKHRKILNKAICQSAHGIWNDPCWHGKNIVLDSLNRVCEEKGWEWNINNSKYEHDENGIPVRKRWIIEVIDPIEKRNGFGMILACGCGSVSDPLEKYDIVTYF
jgi:hypothetical protein